MKLIDVVVRGDKIYVVSSWDASTREISEIEADDNNELSRSINRFWEMKASTRRPSENLSEMELERLSQIGLLDSIGPCQQEMIPAYVPFKVGDKRWCVREGLTIHFFEPEDDVDFLKSFEAIVCEFQNEVEYSFGRDLVNETDVKVYSGFLPKGTLKSITQRVSNSELGFGSLALDCTTDDVKLVNLWALKGKLYEEMEKFGLVTRDLMKLHSLVPAIREVTSQGSIVQLPGYTVLSRHRAISTKSEFPPSQVGRDQLPGLALTKAVAESLERYSGQQWPSESCRLRRPLSEMTEVAIELKDFVNYSPQQSQQPELAPGLLAFDDDSQIDWIKVSGLHGEQSWAPCDLIYYGIDFPTGGGRARLFAGNSSGYAAHTQFESALFGAVGELIERDSLMIWWHNKISPPFVDNRVLDLNVAKRKSYLEDLGFDVYFLDLSLDLAPVVLAVAVSRRNSTPYFLTGASCAPTMPKAAAGALEELETMVWYQLSVREKPRKLSLADISEPMDHGDYYSHPEQSEHWEFLLQNDTLSDRGSNLEFTSHSELYDRLENGGHSIYYRDVTPGDISKSCNIRVVKAIIKGLVPITFGYGFECFGLPRFSELPYALGLTEAKRAPDYYIQDYKPHFFA